MKPTYMIDSKSDKVHPTQAGYNALADAIIMAIMGGYTPGTSEYQVPIVKSNDNIDISSANVNVRIHNSIAELSIYGLVATFKTGFKLSGNTEIELAKLDTSSSLIVGKSTSDSSGYAPVTGLYQVDNKFVPFTGLMRICNGKLYLTNHLINSSGYSWAADLQIQTMRIYGFRITTATNCY
jgi:hypothetical protein